MGAGIPTRTVPPWPFSTLQAAVERIRDLLGGTGTYAYGTVTGGGTITVPAGARVITITGVAAGAVDGTITIDGGAVITVRAGEAFTERPNQILVAGAGGAQIVFSAVMDGFVSWVV